MPVEALTIHLRKFMAMDTTQKPFHSNHSIIACTDNLIIMYNILYFFVLIYSQFNNQFNIIL